MGLVLWESVRYKSLTNVSMQVVGIPKILILPALIFSKKLSLCSNGNIYNSEKYCYCDNSLSAAYFQPLHAPWDFIPCMLNKNNLR